MKMLIKKLVSIALAMVILATGTMTASAETTISDDAGNDYWIFGGRMYDDNGQRHTLNNVECYFEFLPGENLTMYTAINNAVSDWDWHLRYISQTMSEQDGYDYDVYGFGMVNGTNQRDADIRFALDENNLEIPGYAALDGAYAITLPYDAMDRLIVNEVVGQGNWRYSVIRFSEYKFTTYASTHTENETKSFIQRVANHEIGHALGLAHDPRDNGIIMYGDNDHGILEGFVYDDDSWTATVPTLHDLMGVYLMYS